MNSKLRRIGTMMFAGGIACYAVVCNATMTTQYLTGLQWLLLCLVGAVLCIVGSMLMVDFDSKGE